jgi:hypothetical protein
MRGAILATAAAFAGTAVADMHMRRHAHEGLHHRALHASSAVPEEECGCTTEVITYWGEPTSKNPGLYQNGRDGRANNLQLSPSRFLPAP